MPLLKLLDCRMPLRAVLAALCVFLASPSVYAAKEWYAHYHDAQKLIAKGKCREAILSLREAQHLKPRSAVDAQTYGLDFVDFLPYYYEGVCRQKVGEHASAVLLFNIEEEQGAIKRRDQLYQDLIKRRNESKAKVREEQENADRELRARRALAEVQRLRRESDELHKAGRLEDALKPLAEAQKLAELLDPGSQQEILDRAKRLRAELNEKLEHAARVERIEKALAEGRRLLEAQSPAEARLKFDEVLAVDPKNNAAQQGKAEAEDRIVALTTQQQREAAYREGRTLFEAGQYDLALGRLAGADPGNPEHRSLLEKTQKILEGMRIQKELRTKIEGLMAEAESLIAASKHAEAMVKLVGALELDPGNVRARERLSVAERMTGDEIFEKIFPNQPPLLTFIEAPTADVETARVAVLGVATDDRGLLRIVYRNGDAIVGDQTLAPDRDTGGYPRTFKVEHVFTLEPGENRLQVLAVDTKGVERIESFDVTRRLRFYERRAFWPAMLAGALGLVGLGFIAQQARRRRALRSRFNPYIAGAPVLDEEMFFGREKLLARIMNVLHHNSLMITGERRIGKTTFLYHLKRALESDQATDYQFFPVFTDLQGVAEEGFFHAIMSDVVETLRPLPETKEALRFKPNDEDYGGRDFSHDLQRIIEELKTRTPKQVKLTLLIDEVDVLNEYTERINQRLRSIFMKTFSEHLVAVMSGVGIRRVWNSEGSPWYNFFDEIELTAFTREEGESLIREPVEDVFRYQPEAVEGILAMSQLKPYVIQKFCIHAVNRMLEENRTVVTAEDVNAVKDAVLFEGRHEPSAEVSRPLPSPVAH